MALYVRIINYNPQYTLHIWNNAYYWKYAQNELIQKSNASPKHIRKRHFPMQIIKEKHGKTP